VPELYTTLRLHLIAGTNFMRDVRYGLRVSSETVGFPSHWYGNGMYLHTYVCYHQSKCTIHWDMRMGIQYTNVMYIYTYLGGTPGWKWDLLIHLPIYMYNCPSQCNIYYTHITLPVMSNYTIGTRIICPCNMYTC
jgi:hypothetical protein